MVFMSEDEKMERAELADVIDQLRAEIDNARKAGQGKELQFALGPIELEVTVCVEKKGGLKAGLNFWVILGGEHGLTDSTTQRVKLTLQPTLSSDTEGSGGNRTYADEIVKHFIEFNQRSNVLLDRYRLPGWPASAVIDG
jgi:hypothetical protein